MDVGETLAKNGLTDDQLLRLFIKAQDDLIRIIDRANAGSRFGSYRVQQARAIEQIIRRLESQAKKWTQREIPMIFRAGVNETISKLKDIDDGAFKVRFSGVNERAVKILAEDAFLEFGSTITALKRNTLRASLNKRKLQEKIIESVIQGSSTARTQKQLVDILKSDGIEVLKSRNGFGRRFSLEHYTNLLVRTQSMTAYNLGGRNAMLETGRRYGIFPTIRPDIDGDDICNEWERKKYVDLLKDPLPPQSTHPNAVLEGSSFLGYGRIDEMISAQYDGPAIRLNAGDYSTTIGPNHPMLTSRGMVPAKFLKKGDYLVYDDRSVNAPIVRTKEDFDEGILVENCFDSFRAACGYSTIPATSDHFHGDAVFCEDEIEVVLPKGQLLDVLDSCGIERFRQNGFMGSDVQSPTESSLGAGTASFKRILLPAAGSMRGGLPSPYLLVQVEGVEEIRFVGRAFDCTTSTSLYCSDGFVVSNCRHRIQPISFEQLKAERPDLYQKAVGYFRDTNG